MLKRKPAFDLYKNSKFHFQDFLGERLQGNLDNWLLPAQYANPGMIQMFRDRDRKPRWALMPWSGEFAGKYLTSAVLAWRIQQDQRLRGVIDKLVADLADVQDDDGYLGPHPREERLTGKTVKELPLKILKEHPLWDLWGHYHCMLGLLLWHQETGSSQALTTCLRAADYICRRFLDTDSRPIEAGAEEMNLAVIHIFLLLYELTDEERYMQMARKIEKDWETPPAGDYVRTAMAGMEFYETPKPRWESLHDIQAIAELYFITGDEKYKKAFEHIWRSILKGDRHNNGGFSSGEQATGNPYDPRAIETCCTIAWAATSIDMLRLTGSSTVADEIELSTFNAVLGAQHPSGRWWTYNTPMDGVRRASAHDIVFQSYQGTPELNCCSVNGPRGLGMLSEWVVMRSDAGPVVNFYGPSDVSLTLPSGNRLSLTQKTTYPRDGHVTIILSLDRPEEFVLNLRIPKWSKNTKVSLNGEPVESKPGTYLSLERKWRSEDRIDLELDMSLHFWIGEREAGGKTSIYRGPILLAYDQRYNPMDPDDIPTIKVSPSEGTPVFWDEWPRPWVLLKFPAKDGCEVVLCDFASAGATGTHYRSWLQADVNRVVA